jgi:hypothetical protein
MVVLCDSLSSSIKVKTKKPNTSVCIQSRFCLIVNLGSFKVKIHISVIRRNLSISDQIRFGRDGEGCSGLSLRGATDDGRTAFNLSSDRNLALFSLGRDGLSLHDLSSIGGHLRKFPGAFGLNLSTESATLSCRGGLSKGWLRCSRLLLTKLHDLPFRLLTVVAVVIDFLLSIWISSRGTGSSETTTAAAFSPTGLSESTKRRDNDGISLIMSGGCITSE